MCNFGLVVVRQKAPQLAKIRCDLVIAYGYLKHIAPKLRATFVKEQRTQAVAGILSGVEFEAALLIVGIFAHDAARHRATLHAFRPSEVPTDFAEPSRWWYIGRRRC
jgi:hypothetical protein